MAIGIHCPVALRESAEPYLKRLSRFFDADGHERGERINGYCQCPKCGLWWPRVEEPDMWVEGEGGKWFIDGWWGAAVCCECHLLMVEQPDGTPECYRL
jgi:hypothetical protein